MNINVLDYFEKTAAAFPDKIGYEDKWQTATFSEFRKNALKISSFLIAKVDVLREPVGVFLPKSVNALMSFTGILYSGNIYVPLDVKNPAERLKAIFGNLEPAAVITDETNAAKLEGILPADKIFLISDILESDFPERTNYGKIVDVDPAYIINTSGSTGTPKGVTVSHRSIIDYTEWLLREPKFRPNSDDVIGNQTPFFFDKSITDIYINYATGAKIVIIPEEMFVFALKVLKFIDEKGVTLISWVPTTLAYVCNYRLLDKCRPRALRKIIVSGEVMRTKHMNYWLDHYPDIFFSNFFGPTELTDICVYYVVDRAFSDDEPLPIGFPCRNIDAFVLDENGALVSAPGVVGELCIRGSCLSLGYYRDFERSDKVFMQNPLNRRYYDRIYKTGDLVYYNKFGELVYKGRNDFLVKHSGHRIELGEIETALGSVGKIQNGCVVYDFDRSKIVLFYQAKSDLAVSEINAVLKKKLPEYMLVNAAVRLPAFPANANGKTDRKALTAKLKEIDL